MSGGAFMEVSRLLVRRGQKRILEIPELEIRSGEVLGIIGPNGAGKSTLLRTLAALERPDDGEVRLNGKPITQNGTLLKTRRQMAVVFQEPLLLSGTVFENVAVGLRYRGWKPRVIAEEVQKWLVRFGIQHLAGRSTHSLSGGEAQRVNLARAFAVNPKIVFLDEPFASLDSPTRANLICDLRDILASTGITAVLVTHSFDELPFLCDRVGVLMDGWFVQVGTPNDVLRRPANLSVAEFVGVENVLPGKLKAIEGNATVVELETGQRIRAEVAEAWASLGKPVMVCILPGELALRSYGETEHGRGHRTETASEIPHLQNRLWGKITAVMPFGIQVKATIDCGFPLTCLLGKAEALRSGDELSPGRQCTVVFSAASVHLLSVPG